MGLSAATAASPEPWPRTVSANYTINFAGLNIGSFSFQSDLQGDAYKLTGQAKLSVALGAFRWQGSATSIGRTTIAKPQPKSFDFEFKRNRKSGTVALAFAKGRVSAIDIKPQDGPDPRKVPIKPEHLANVYDPLSAVLAVSRTSDGDPCQRRVPVFDGNQRFDLIFEFIRRQPIRDTRPTGQPQMGYLCRVRYVPISGHKTDKASMTLADSSAIEVLLRPIPAASLFVPVYVRVPTVVGPATLTARTVDITTASSQRIALQE